VYRRLDGQTGREKSRIYGYRQDERLLDHRRALRTSHTVLLVFTTALGAPAICGFGFRLHSGPYPLYRAYTSLPTALKIVHFDGTHPIPPQ
jgi:hypothetical protein